MVGLASLSWLVVGLTYKEPVNVKVCGGEH